MLVGLGVLLALILVYRVLASQFKSLEDPFTIMFSVPMGLIDVFWALYLTNTTLVLIPTLYVILEERFPRELARSEEHMPA